MCDDAARSYFFGVERRVQLDRIQSNRSQRDEECGGWTVIANMAFTGFIATLLAASPIALRLPPHALHRLLDAAAESLLAEGVAVMLRPYPSVAM
jgi:hypothetical protein